jgi:hypothetical protein
MAQDKSRRTGCGRSQDKMLVRLPGSTATPGCVAAGASWQDCDTGSKNQRRESGLY